MKSFCLSIAGHDPCGGAGLLADIKAFEYVGVTGLGVVSALTYQNDAEFKGVEWCSLESIHQQLKPLRHYPVKAVKIGLIEHINRLEQVVDLVRAYFPDAYILWDPILQASAGFTFHNDPVLSETLCSKMNLITPNYEEYYSLNLDKQQLTCSILLKGGHRTEFRGVDLLYSNGIENQLSGIDFNGKKEKHGTGCVLSAAIVGFISLGYDELEACKKGKEVVERLMLSNPTRLGTLNDMH